MIAVGNSGKFERLLEALIDECKLRVVGLCSLNIKCLTGSHAVLVEGWIGGAVPLIVPKRLSIPPTNHLLIFQRISSKNKVDITSLMAFNEPLVI